MPAFDVDIDTPVPPPANPETPPTNPEQDQVLFNGHHLGFLTGKNDTWIQNSFVVPIELVKFPARGSLGKTPTPAVNTITINIDTANATEAWCTSIDWAALTMQGMSPIILIHGNNSDPGFFDRRGFSGFLQFLKLPFDGCGADPTKGGLCKNPIKLPTDDIYNNGLKLDSLIPPVVKSFGVDSVHLIAHSKGGLDAREYLAKYQPGDDSDFRVLSLTTLSTPHNGSVGADILDQRKLFINYRGKVDFGDLTTFAKVIAELIPLDPGKISLTAISVKNFNNENVRLLPKNTVFNTVAADADTNCNGKIDRIPDEYVELRAESKRLAAIDAVPVIGQFWSQQVIDTVYKTLLATPQLAVIQSEERAPSGGIRVVATLTRVPNHSEVFGNDTEVPITSGHGINIIKVANKATFKGADKDGKACVESPAGINILVGRNHASVVSAEVVSTIVPWLVKIEQTIGDLQ
jgi:pimeloyl-ACP methyl ester carboxylesterase